MTDQAIRTPIRTDDDLADAYLQQLQALAFEISLALNAIAANTLASFKQSVEKQEMLCGVLASITSTIRARVGSSEKPLLVVGDHSVVARIHKTTEAIRKLNLQYAALLKHSGRSIALLAALCRSHTGQFQEARGPRSKRQTWSCEA